MNKLFKTITAAAVASLMAVSLSASASAVCPPHYGGNPSKKPLNNYTAGQHDHIYYYDIDGNPHYKKCTITIQVYRHETRCVICNELLDTYDTTETHHSIS